MSTQRDFDRVIQDWLELGPTELSDQVVQTVRSTIGRTSQRRFWPSVRTAVSAGGARRLSLAIGLAVVVVAIGVVGYGLTSRGIQAGSSANPSVSPSASTVSVQRLTFEPEAVSGNGPDAAALDEIRYIVAQRLRATGIAQPVVDIDAQDRVVVDLPVGVDVAAVERLLTEVGQVTFVPLPPETYGTASTTGSPTGIVDGQPLPADSSLRPLFSGDHLVSADRVTDQNGSPAVSFTLDQDARQIFANYTMANIGDFFAIVMDGTVLSAPSINSPITDGVGQVSIGTEAGAEVAWNDLVAVVRSGPLPFPLRPVVASP